MLNMDTLRSELKLVIELITSKNKIEVEERLDNVRCYCTSGIICIVTAVVCAVIALIGMSLVLLPIFFGCVAFIVAGVGIGLVVHGESFAKQVKAFIESLTNNKKQEPAIAVSDDDEDVDGVSEVSKVSPKVMKCSEEEIELYLGHIRNQGWTILDCLLESREELCEEDQIRLWEERCKVANSALVTGGIANLLEEDLYSDLPLFQYLGKEIEKIKVYCEKIYGKLDGFDPAFQKAFLRYSSLLYK